MVTLRYFLGCGSSSKTGTRNLWFPTTSDTFNSPFSNLPSTDWGTLCMAAQRSTMVAHCSTPMILCQRQHNPLLLWWLPKSLLIRYFLDGLLFVKAFSNWFRTKQRWRMLNRTALRNFWLMIQNASVIVLHAETSETKMLHRWNGPGKGD